MIWITKEEMIEFSRHCELWTPLDFAASEGHVDVCQYLLEEDVAPNPQESDKVKV